MEAAFLNGEQLVGVAVDFAKAFDNIPIAVALALLKKLGASDLMLNPLISMYAVLKRRFKIKGYLREVFRATNGIMQGCPFSCRWSPESGQPVLCE